MLSGTLERSAEVLLETSDLEATGKKNALNPWSSSTINALMLGGLDYEETEVTLTFGEAVEACVNISTTQDGVFEGNEEFMVSLSTLDNAVSLTDSSINVTILDIDTDTGMTMCRESIHLTVMSRHLTVMSSLRVRS